MCTLEKPYNNIFVLTLTGDDEHRLNPTLIGSILSALRDAKEKATSGSVLITTSRGKFFSNGFDLAWARAAGSKPKAIERLHQMVELLKPVVAELISLPMPTVAAINGHAAAGGLILALSHDYVYMKRDRGVLYMSEVDIGLTIPDYFNALIRAKVGSPSARRDVLLRGAKVRGDEAVSMGIVEGAHDNEERLREATMNHGKQLASRKWDGVVYKEIRKRLYPELCVALGLGGAETDNNIFVLTLTGDDEHRLNPTLIGSILSALRDAKEQATSGSVLITTSRGKFFSNGLDLAWAQAAGSKPKAIERLYHMAELFKPVVAELISLPMPTIAAINGHAAAGGLILALSHDYVYMKRDRGVLYMSEVDLGLTIPDYVIALLRAKIGSPSARRDVLLRGAKVRGDEAVSMGIVEGAHDNEERLREATMSHGKQLGSRKWDGEVYKEIRKSLYPELCVVLGLGAAEVIAKL
ncbi:hypothetical protein SADUNF_Sadunf08G0135000 [Salix dunnii]|uniref:Delta(3)-Delta(2)-enoyl-CoA isomerase n=1 Tax=Salix dunnii TaxID=1413687 RepID=A0A835JUK1_9ROSI|nr:hypothetical protein SADUNF_Sadunf08G0135000 [Salix dunnii]